jgi:hypothetical protein
MFVALLFRRGVTRKRHTASVKYYESRCRARGVASRGVKQAMRASSLILGNSLARWPATCACGASVVNHIRGGKNEYATSYRGRQGGLQPISRRSTEGTSAVVLPSSYTAHQPSYTRISPPRAPASAAPRPGRKR